MSETLKKDALTMLFIHSKQVEVWAEMVLDVNKSANFDFKFKLKNLYAQSKLFNKFISTDKKVEDEVYELSAQVSDSIIELAKMEKEDLDEVIKLIESKRVRK